MGLVLVATAWALRERSLRRPDALHVALPSYRMGWRGREIYGPLAARRLVAFVAASGSAGISRSELAHAIYGDREDGGPLCGISRLLESAQAVVRRHGLILRARYGRGWRLLEFDVTTAGGRVPAQVWGAA